MAERRQTQNEGSQQASRASHAESLTEPPACVIALFAPAIALFTLLPLWLCFDAIYDQVMLSSVPAESTLVPSREAIDPKFTWDLSAIFADWDAWEAAYRELDRGIASFRQFEGTLAQGAERLRAALRTSRTRSGSWPTRSGTTRRCNTIRINATTPSTPAGSGCSCCWPGGVRRRPGSVPSCCRIPLATVRQWMDDTPGLALYRFSIEDLFRQQAHVLDEAGEKLLSLSSRLGGVPNDAYAALSTADARFPTITLTTGESVQVSYGQYRKLLATCRPQADRRAAYEALYDTYGASLNTYATLYNGVVQREWFEARARGHQSTLEAALFGNNIPTSVVENLIRETKAGVEPFRRYHRLRRRVLGLSEYFAFDGFISLVDHDVRYKYDEVLDSIVDSVRPARRRLPAARA